MSRKNSLTETESKNDSGYIGPDLLGQLQTDPHSRRAFLTRMGAAGLGLAAISLLNGCGGGSSNGSGGAPSFPLALPGKTDDQKVLNYALTLEILEADLYRQALNLATGRPLTDALAASPSAYTQGQLVSSGGLDSFNTAAGFAYLRDFAFVEAAHRDFLITALSGKPQVTRNANGYTFGGPVNADLKSILTALLPLEETGVRAYLGAVPFVDAYKTIGQTAVSIYSTEARHSSAINYILDLPIGPVFKSGDNKVTPNYPHENTFEYFLTPQQVLQAITPLIVP